MSLDRGTGSSKFAPVAGLLALALSTMVAQGLARFSYGPLLPLMRDDVVQSYVAGGTLATVHMIGYLAGALTSLVLASRVPPARAVMTGLTGTVLGLTLLAISTGPVMAGMGMLLTGLGGAMVWLPAPGLAATMFPVDPGRAIGVVASSMGVGICLGSAVPAVAGFLGGWRMVWGAQALLAALILVAALLLLRPAAPTPASNRFGQRRWHPDRPWWLATLAFSGFSLGTVTFLTFLVAGLRDTGTSSETANGIYSLVGLAMITGGVMSERLSRSLGRNTTLLSQVLLSSAAILVAAAGHPAAAGAAALILGSSMSGTAAVVSAGFNDRLSPTHATAAFSLMFIPVGIGQIAGPVIGGVAGELTGYPLAPLIVAGVAMGTCSLPLAIAWTSSRRRR